MTANLVKMLLFFFWRFSIFYADKRDSAAWCLLRRLKMRVHILTAPSVIVIWAVTHPSTMYYSPVISLRKIYLLFSITFLRLPPPSKF
jgi:hypothetical protein